MKTLAQAADAAELFDRLSRLRVQTARRWGRMTPHEMVCHLADGFRMAAGEKAVSPMRGIPLRPLVKLVVLYLPVPWVKGVPTRPELVQGEGGTCPTDFAADLADLVARMERFVSEERALDGRVHPVFGRMSGSAWMRWAYLHVDHHLRQFGL
jgi:hypothetical protein